jgi:hypothetical protein
VSSWSKIDVRELIRLTAETVDQDEGENPDDGTGDPSWHVHKPWSRFVALTGKIFDGFTKVRKHQPTSSFL